MKKLLAIFTVLVLAFTLASCRKNSAKNLEIVSHKGTTYVLKYCASKPDFGTFYLTITDEALVNFYCKYDNAAYKVQDVQLLLGSYSAALTANDENGTITYTLSTPYEFIKGKDDDGYEIVNTQKIAIYINFVDINKGVDGADQTNLKTASSLSISSTPNDLITFIRNKEIKENPKSTTTTA